MQDKDISTESVSDSAPSDSGLRAKNLERVIFFIDGFNFFHSLKSVKEENEKNLYWLDLSKLCQNNIDEKNQKIEQIHYFTSKRPRLKTKKMIIKKC